MLIQPLKKRHYSIITGLFLIILASVFLLSGCEDQGVTELPSSLSFLVISDWGMRGNNNQTVVAEQMGIYAYHNSVDFIISAGDNFYSVGIENITDSQWDESFNLIYNAPSLMCPWYVSLGNHDNLGSVQAQIDYSDVSSRWNLPSTYYTFTKNISSSITVQFFILDSDPLQSEYTHDPIHPFLPGSPEEDQFIWFENELESSNAMWKIVISHHPAFSGGHHGPSEFVQNEIVPLLTSNSVQLLLSGHEHDLQHINPGDGTQYIVSGAAGSIRTTEHTEFTEFSTGVLAGFVEVTLSEEFITVTFIDSEGNILHEVKIDLTGNLVN
jgi:tartrate-resistant acid phosphatase type 5